MKDVNVRGYERRNGTKVDAYKRSSPSPKYVSSGSSSGHGIIFNIIKYVVLLSWYMIKYLLIILGMLISFVFKKL